MAQKSMPHMGMHVSMPTAFETALPHMLSCIKAL